MIKADLSQIGISVSVRKKKKNLEENVTRRVMKKSVSKTKPQSDNCLPKSEFGSATTLLMSGLIGKDLLTLARSGERMPSMVEMMAALVHYLIELSDNNPCMLIKSMGGNEYQILELHEDKFGALIESIFYHEKTKTQVRALFEAQAIIDTIHFPKVDGKSFIEYLFMTLYDTELLPEEPFLKWRDTVNDFKGKGKAILQCYKSFIPIQ